MHKKGVVRLPLDMRTQILHKSCFTQWQRFITSISSVSPQAAAWWFSVRLDSSLMIPITDIFKIFKMTGTVDKQFQSSHTVNILYYG